MCETAVVFMLGEFEKLKTYVLAHLILTFFFHLFVFDLFFFVFICTFLV